MSGDETGVCGLTCAQRHWLLVLAGTRHGELGDPRKTAGAVALGLRELMDTGWAARGSRGALVPLCGAEEAPAHLHGLATELWGHALDEAGWVERLCLGPSARPTRSVCDDLTRSLAGRELFSLRGRGAIGRLVGAPLCPDGDRAALDAAAEHVLAELAGVPASADDARVARMLCLWKDGRDARRIAARFSRTAAWHELDPVVRAIENAGFMGASLAGAFASS